MKLTIDSEAQTLTSQHEGDEFTLPLYSKEAFELISQQWIRVGWNQKYSYTFSWMGRPVIQLPEDLIRIQELIYRLRPDVILETGVAHGGSLIFFASLCKTMDQGRVIGVDIEIRPQNRKAIESHQLSSLITLIEGNSVNAEVVREVKAQVRANERAIVLLDSCHTKEHVLAELNAYSPLVSVGSYIVAMDGIMEQVVGAPRTQTDWAWSNPRQAALEFVQTNKDFVIEEPSLIFNEGNIANRLTYCPDGFIKRIA